MFAGIGRCNQGLCMARLIQQINLYHPEFRHELPQFHAAQMLLAGVVVAFALMALTAYAYVDNWQLEKQLAEIQQQKQQKASELQEIKSKLKSIRPNRLLEAKKERLIKELKEAKTLSLLMSSEIERPAHPYSRYFRALAESTVNGLWLEQLQIGQYGRQIKIAGYSYAPENVPILLQVLKANEVFAGRTFEQVEMTRKQGTDESVHFSMLTLRSDGEGKR